jgi:hypothetical protein
MCSEWGHLTKKWQRVAGFPIGNHGNVTFTSPLKEELCSRLFEYRLKPGNTSPVEAI